MWDQVPYIVLHYVELFSTEWSHTLELITFLVEYEAFILYIRNYCKKLLKNAFCLKLFSYFWYSCKQINHFRCILSFSFCLLLLVFISYSVV
jgi:hypothetical protein